MVTDLPNCNCYETYPGPGSHREGCSVKDALENLRDVYSANKRLGNALEAAQADIERLREERDRAFDFGYEWAALRKGTPEQGKQALAAAGEDDDRGTVPHQNGEKA